MTCTCALSVSLHYFVYSCPISQSNSKTGHRPYQKAGKEGTEKVHATFEPIAASDLNITFNHMSEEGYAV